MTAEPTFTITYWGITGTLTSPLLPQEVTAKIIASIEDLLMRGRLDGLQPGPELRAALAREIEALPFHLRSTYGGNTTCVEIKTPDEVLILDCGSGFRELGRALQQRWNAPDYKGDRTAHVLVTHPHMDHTYATAFFSPYFDPRNNFTIWGTRTVITSLEAVLSPTSELSHVYFPPTFDMMKALRKFEEIHPWKEFQIGNTKIRTFPLRHPGGCLAFRLERAGKAYVFATDHEQVEAPDTALASFAHGADILYTEGQYTQAEYEGKQGVPGEGPLPRFGWGHSSIEACVKTAVAAGVRALHLGHREPARSDADLARLENEARLLARQACQVLIPFEGMTVTL
jgi:phosphoribosyl 1,2-cyclic phosphodiesterase